MIQKAGFARSICAIQALIILFEAKYICAIYWLGDWDRKYFGKKLQKGRGRKPSYVFDTETNNFQSGPT